MARHRRKRKRRRFVDVVARPLKAAGPFSFISEGKFPICHWGVLFSEFDEETLKQIFAESESKRTCGTYIELFRDPSQNHRVTHNVIDFFNPSKPRSDAVGLASSCRRNLHSRSCLEGGR